MTTRIPRSHAAGPLLRGAALISICSLSCLGAAESPSVPGQAAAYELETLKARIRELETVLGQQREAPVSTASAREAGAQARAGAGDAAKAKLLIDLVHLRKGAELSRELGALLARGDESFPTLFDFCHELDRDSREALLLTFDYRNSFSLSHLAMLHEDQLARFAHYFLAASAAAPRSTLRRTLFDYLPDLLRYHRGRYPELEHDIESEVVRHLTEGKGDLQVYYRVIRALNFKPPIELFDPLLAAAGSHAETLPVALQLQARDDSIAVEILSRNITQIPPENEWKASILLSALARMSTPEAAEALSHFITTGDDRLRSTAVLAYFSVPRDRSSLALLIDFLNSSADTQHKRATILRLRQTNSEIYQALKPEIDKIRLAEVRDLLRNEK